MVRQKKDIKSKEELLEIMNDHFKTQQEFAIKLKEKAQSSIDDEEGSDSKKVNKYLHAYNSQVEAVTKTSKMMISIYNSTYEEESEEEQQTNSLLD